jgi:hypothetical protein
MEVLKKVLLENNDGKLGARANFMMLRTKSNFGLNIEFANVNVSILDRASDSFV